MGTSIIIIEWWYPDNCCPLYINNMEVIIAPDWVVVTLIINITIVFIGVLLYAITVVSLDWITVWKFCFIYSFFFFFLFLVYETSGYVGNVFPCVLVSTNLNRRFWMFRLLDSLMLIQKLHICWKQQQNLDIFECQTLKHWLSGIFYTASIWTFFYSS